MIIEVTNKESTPTPFKVDTNRIMYIEERAKRPGSIIHIRGSYALVDSYIIVSDQSIAEIIQNAYEQGKKDAAQLSGDLSLRLS